MRTANIRAIEAYIKKVAARLLYFVLIMFWLGYFFGEKL